jgi:hypothetical protein
MKILLSWPLWLQLTTIIVPFATATVFLTLFSRKQDREDRSNDSVATAIMRFAGAAFVFLGAFAIVTSWQSTNSTLVDIQKESAAVTSIAQDTLAIDAPEAQALRDLLAEYANVVRDVELAQAPRVTLSEDAENLVYDISDAAYELSQTDYLSDQEVGSLYKDFDAFKQARNSRLGHSASLVPDSILWALLAMGSIMILVSGIFPSGPSRLIKWVQSGSGLVVVLLVLGTVFAVQSGETTLDSFRHPLGVYLDTYEGF